MPNLETLNRRLKEDRIKVRLEERCGSLFLRATLPCPTTGARKQQRIRLETTDPVAANKEAHFLFELMGEPASLWPRWNTRHIKRGELTLGEFRERGEAFWKAKNIQPKSWETKWGPALRKLPESDDILCSTELLVAVVEGLPPGSAVRRDQGNVLAQIARHVGLDGDAVQDACRGYDGSKLKPREIPSDKKIEEIYMQIQVPHWKWMFGMMATYGLRNHECAMCEFDDDRNVDVHWDTKTGERSVWPCHDHWVDKFDLTNVQRPPFGKDAIGHKANQAIHQKGPAPFGLYNLRHAYGIRLFKHRVEKHVAAMLMGHSLAIHERDYGRWYNKKSIHQLKSNYAL